MKVEKYVMGVFSTNTYILEENNQVIVIDPAGKNEKVDSLIGERELVAILLTHGHFDHIKAVDGLYKKYRCPIYINETDEKIARDPKQGEVFGINNSAHISSPLTFLKQGSLKIEDFKIEVIFTPGHTGGSVCYLVDDSLFTGDTLFHLACGRTDLYSGSDKQMKSSLRLLKELDDELLVYPGHEDSSILKIEKQFNPYMKSI